MKTSIKSRSSNMPRSSSLRGFFLRFKMPANGSVMPLVLLILIIGTLSFITSCDTPTGYDSDYTIPSNNQYVVNGYVLRNGVKQVGANVSIWIKDYSYTMGQCTFFCKTGYDGKYEFIVTYDKWNRYYYRMYCKGIFIEGRITFGEVDKVNINL